ncbi:hypothetical protein ABPG75_003459 [Micractinium tetrahymenae]
MATIDALPDSLLVFIFSRLSQHDRRRFGARVCRRWQQLCNSAPQLLRCTSARVGGHVPGAAHLRSFCRWLMQHAAPHVQRLSLQITPHAQTWDIREQLCAAAAAGLTACGLAGSLTALRLEGPFCEPPVWTGSMHALRGLTLIADGPHHDSWHCVWPQDLAALQELSLSGSLFSLLDADLPTGLTRLHLDLSQLQEEEPEDEPSLPEDLWKLTRLHTLCVAGAQRGIESLGDLRHLRRLSLCNCSAWPDGLSQLTCLEALVLVNSEAALMDAQDDAAAFVAALPHLPLLTHLALDDPAQPGPPAELAALSSLRSLAWLHPAVLPADSPWLGRLTRLALAAESAAALAPALAAAAPRLESLGLSCGVHTEPDLASLLRCVPGMPACRRLLLAGSEQVFGRSAQVMLDAQRAAPHLRVLCSEHPGALWREFVCDFAPDLSREGFLAAAECERH